MAVPKYFEMIKPFLKHLEDGREHQLNELKVRLQRDFRLSTEEMAELLPSGRQTVFANRIGWARTYLKKAGLISSPSRATYVITAVGKRVLAEDPPVIDVDYLMQFEAFREFQGIPVQRSGRPALVEETDETPDDVFEDAFKRIRQSLKDELLSEVMKLSSAAFEQMVLDLMSQMGYGTFENASRTTPATGDEGIDGIIMEDKLGFDLIYIQAKKWGENHVVGRPEIQAFVGAIAGRNGKGMFVTTSRFSEQAREYAANQHIILLDGDKLTDYMIEYNFGVSVKRTFEVKAIDTDVFMDYQDT